jgi:hypothetical protein
MQVTIETNAACTIVDGFHLMNLARQVVEVTKPRDDWEAYYPDSPTTALQLLIREAIGQRLLACGGVVLHEIGQRVNFA